MLVGKVNEWNGRKRQMKIELQRHFAFNVKHKISGAESGGGEVAGLRIGKMRRDTKAGGGQT